MGDDATNRTEACWRQVLRLLQRRPHSCRELSLKLCQRGYPRPVIEAALAEAERLNLVDDAAFAAAYREELQRKGFGAAKVRAALYRRGVAAADQEAKVANSADREQALADERERARAAIARKRSSLAREPDPRKRRDKLIRFLLGRGYAHDLVRELIGEEEII